MAAVVSQEDGGTRRFNGWDRVGATFAQKDDEKLSLRNSGAMRQGDISEWLHLKSNHGRRELSRGGLGERQAKRKNHEAGETHESTELHRLIRADAIRRQITKQAKINSGAPAPSAIDCAQAIPALILHLCP